MTDLASRLAAHLKKTELDEIKPQGHEQQATLADLLVEWSCEFAFGYDTDALMDKVAQRAIDFIKTEAKGT